MEYQETDNGLIITVKVKPGSARFSLTRKSDQLVLEVTSPAREGKANQEIVTELPKLLRCRVAVLRGSSSSRKLLMLTGITAHEFEGFLDTR